MKVRIIIFSRTPYCGAVKTRLAKTIGAAAATKLYRLMLARAIAATQNYESYIAITPNSLPDNVLRNHRNFVLPVLAQGNGDLGKRLERLAKKFAPVIFIGSDSLTITQKDITRAVEKLKSNDLVIAPASDGGYGLIGLKSPYLHVFKNIRWSSAETLKDTLAHLHNHKVCLLPELLDIDEVEDLDSTSSGAVQNLR